MRIISPERLLQLKTKYTRGTRVKLLRMNDPYTKLSLGETGTVTGVDDIGTIHVSWDCGSSLGVAYGEDSCEIVKDSCEEEKQ
ncbi:DUF4314 domain-containing protein [Youngiibacter fragilis]|uniref:Methyltransferase n=1 Tax=Youngiibacter fragilis 232.1 TaxID=994573 RepID=V7I6Z5_9CLOT|nr:DUF4314 domain-containing protein [Youngiibacter fragilis]ETA80989.1 methyltransferase [Youngiibacter fragilis 232.1]